MEYQRKPNATCMACGYPMFCHPHNHPLHKPGECVKPSRVDREMMDRIATLERMVAELSEKNDGSR